MANDSRIGILIEAKDSASSVMKNVKNNANELGKAAGDVTSLSGAFQGLGKAAGLAGVAFGALKVGQAVADLARTGAEAQRLEDSFKILARQAGQSSDDILSALQNASRGTISNNDLILTANRALALGVADTAQEMSQLMEVAIARGKALGLSSTQAFNDLVTGIGRMSPLILDNLGIITGGEKVFQDYAASIGRSVESLSDVERKQALVNKVISETSALISENAAAGNDAASSFERAEAAFTNIKADLGELFAPAIAKIAEQLADAVEGVRDALTTDSSEQLQSLQGDVSKLNDMMNRYNSAIERMQQAGISGDGSGLKQAAAEAQGLQLLMQGIATEYNKVAAAMGKPLIDVEAIRRGEIAYTDASLAADRLAASGQTVSSSMVNQQSAAANLNASINLLAGSYDLLIQRANILAGLSGSLGSIASQVVSATDASTGVAFFNSLTSAAEQQIKAWQETGYSQEEITNVLMPAYQSQVRKSAEETYGFGAAATRANRAAAAAVKALNAEYENLKGKVSGVLSGALSDIGGIKLDEILPRQDSVSEDARRLADVAVNGFASPWADYLANKFPDTIGAAFAETGDVKQAAAQLLKDFQDGLRPELLDKDRAKELVKRAILGERNLKSLTDEIAKELAGELGISVEQAQQAATQALGGGTTSVGGTGTGKTVPIVPVVDTTKLPTKPIDLKATIDTLTLAVDVEYPDVTIPIGYLKEIGLFANVVLPDVSIPVGYLKSLELLASATLPTIPQFDAHVNKVSLTEDATLPSISSLTGYISTVNLLATATLPSVSTLTGYISTVNILASTELPAVKLTATIANVSLQANSVTETPLVLSAKVTPFVGNPSTDNLANVRTFITETLPVIVTPQISTEGIATSAALTYLEQELAPLVTPYINYLGIPAEDLQAAGAWIVGGINTGIQAANIGSAIVTSINNAQESIKSSGKTSGTNWGAGFLETVGTNVPSALINILVALVTPGVQDAINRQQSRTGAQ